MSKDICSSKTIDISDFLLLITILPLAYCFRWYFLVSVCLFSNIFSHGNISYGLCLLHSFSCKKFSMCSKHMVKRHMSFRLETTYHGWWNNPTRLISIIWEQRKGMLKCLVVGQNYGISTARMFLCRLITYTLSWLFTEHDVARNTKVFFLKFYIVISVFLVLHVCHIQ